MEYSHEIRLLENARILLSIVDDVQKCLDEGKNILNKNRRFYAFTIIFLIQYRAISKKSFLIRVQNHVANTLISKLQTYFAIIVKRVFYQPFKKKLIKIQIKKFLSTIDHQHRHQVLLMKRVH